MAKYDGPKFNTEWHTKRDTSKMVIFITVDQVTGTHASWEIQHHYGLEDWEKDLLSKYTSDSKDNSEEALHGVLSRLLGAYHNRMELARALEQE
jgi:hypothetical protein